MENTEMEPKSLPRVFRETEVLVHRYLASLRSEEFDPERGQGRILALLQKTDQLTQRDLAYILNIRQQSLGELVRKLEENGYVTRTPGTEDKRTMIVALTEKGRELEMPKRPLETVFDCLDEQEQQDLRSCLEKVCDRIEELLPEEAKDSCWPGPAEDFGRGRPFGPPPAPGPGMGHGPGRPRGFGPGPLGPEHHRHHGPRGCGFELHGWLAPGVGRRF